MTIFLLILGLVMFVGLVVIHEFGHFIMAKRSGVEVEEFGIGFPPRAKVLAKKNGTVYTLNWLPLGGFVKLKGENDSCRLAGSYGAASLGSKVKILVAGVIMNLLAAFVILTFLALVGMPKLLSAQFSVPKNATVVRQQLLAGYVEPNSPAQKAGLKVQDVLLGYIDTNNNSRFVALTRADQLAAITPLYSGKNLQLKIKNAQGVEQFLNISLRTKDEVKNSNEAAGKQKGYMGVASSEYTVQRYTWAAPIVAAGTIKQFSVLTFQGLGSAAANLFRGNTSKASENVSGPVGIFVILQNGSLLGYQFILMIIAVISLTLAIMNALPIPALDGGRLFVTLLFKVARRPLKKSTEERVHGTGFVLLMLLFVLITVVDIKRNF